MMILHEWRSWQRAANLSERTVTERARVVQQVCDHAGILDPLDMTPRHVVRFLARPSLSRSARASYYASLTAFWKWAVRVRAAEASIMAEVPAPKRPAAVPRPVQSVQLAAILRTVNRSRTRAMVLLAALAGLRVHEIAKVHGQDFDLEAGTLVVVGKGGKRAVIPLHPELVALAWEQPMRGYWFTSYTDRSRPITSRAVGKAIAGAMQRAGVEGTAHQLRHWYGTELLDSGASLRTVQELLRHESVATTQIYTRVSSRRRSEAIGGLRLPHAA